MNYGVKYCIISSLSLSLSLSLSFSLYLSIDPGHHIPDSNSAHCWPQWRWPKLEQVAECDPLHHWSRVHRRSYQAWVHTYLSITIHFYHTCARRGYVRWSRASYTSAYTCTQCCQHLLTRNPKIYEENPGKCIGLMGIELKNPNMLHLHIQIRHYSCSKILILGQNPSFWQHCVHMYFFHVCV